LARRFRFASGAIPLQYQEAVDIKVYPGLYRYEDESGC
jgi:hypothetical protein